MKILTCDIASKMGYAFGVSGSKPMHGSMQVRKPFNEPWESSYLMEKFLSDMWAVRSNVPDIMVVERPLAQAVRSFIGENGQKQIQATGIEPVIIAFGLVNGAYAMARHYGIRFEIVAPQTWQSFILGKGKRPSGKALKAAVQQRLRAIGYFPYDCKDDNRSDAVALWLYAETVFARKIPQQLVLHGEEHR